MGWPRIMAIGVLCLGGAGIYQLNLPREGGDTHAASSGEVRGTPVDSAATTGTRSRAVLVRAVDKPARRSRRVTTGAVTQEVPQGSTSDERLSSEATAWVRVVGSRVNMRSRPTGSASRVNSYRRDTHLQLLEKKGEWPRAPHPESETAGWMFGKFLRESPPPREDIAERSGRRPG